MKSTKRRRCDAPIASTAVTVEDEGSLVRAGLPPVEDDCESLLQADGRLAERCLAGDVAAWEEFYAQCHEPLCTSIKILLGRPHCDPNLVDEIAARVWYALVAKDGQLLASYSPAREARLITFMRIVARDEISRHFRTEIRRRERELSALRERPQLSGTDSAQAVVGLREFLSTLTPQEHSFYYEVLLGEPAPTGAVLRTASNIWQLTHRVYEKLTHFLGGGK